MEIIHSLGILSINKNADENAGFLLTNRKGSYCSFFNIPSSRYYGFFYFDEKLMEMHRFIENIEIIENNAVANIRNGFYFIERKKDGVTESFFVPQNFNSLIYELSREKEIDLLLDCKKSYDNREFGRHYSIFEEDGCIIVKFIKKTDEREDETDGEKEFELFLAIKSNSKSYSINDKWLERNYFSDEARNSLPFKRHVYNALRLKGTKFVFSVSKNKGKATEECTHVFNNINEIKNNEKNQFAEFLKNESIKKILMNQKISGDIKIAYVNALYSLDKLAFRGKNNDVFAGLPWFFQFWSRDTLVSLKALSKLDNKMAENILFSYLDRINDEGRLPDIVNKDNKLGSADAHGWLFFRIEGFVQRIHGHKRTINSIKDSLKSVDEYKNKNPNIKNYLKKYSLIISKKENTYHKTLFDIECCLEKSIISLLKRHTKDAFETNSAKETWMDTDFNSDNREGIRIEIQALRLNMYKLMLELSQNQKYKILENLLKSKIRQHFWNGKILADGLNDFTIRPNVFIAAYAYPELLSSKEWEDCFGNALKALWLEWGGLSTIDKNNPLFTDYNTGEDAKSYHRGDSWLWINNLAALMLNRVNGDKFKNHIRKIIDASTEEILWKDCIGCHSEISSARELSSKGCFSQAWSNAMYAEMIEEILG